MQATKRGKEIPTSWFVLAIILAVVLSFIISLIIIDFSQQATAAQSDARNTGTIIVEVLPESSDSGTINVNMKGG